MDRAVSVSAQRIGSLFRQHPAVPLPDRLKSAFTSLGLFVNSVAIQKAEASEDYLLTATGFHADGTPFAFASAPFLGDPVARAEQAASDLIAAHTGQPAGATVTDNTGADTPNQDAVAKAVDASPIKPGDLKDAMARFRARKASFAQTLVETEQKLEEAMSKAEAHVKGQQSEVQAFLDELAQLTNGGPV